MKENKKYAILGAIVIIAALLFIGIFGKSFFGNADNEETTSTVSESTSQSLEKESQKSTEETTKAVESTTKSTETTKKTEKATEKTTEKVTTAKATEATTKAAIDKNGTYCSKEEVALYIHTYGCLPSNYMKKADAEKLGWTGGSLEKYAKGKCIGGDRFGNYEGLLPKKNGRTYTECDIDTLGASSRGAKRIIFSNDGLIYYTEDHYATFELLYE